MTAFIHEPVKLWAPQLTELVQELDGVAYIAGGAARQLIMVEDAPPAGDIDLFIYHSEEFGKCLKMVQSLGYEIEDEQPTSIHFAPRGDRELEVQVIRPYHGRWSLSFGSPEDVISHFSFTTEMFAVTKTQAIYGDRSKKHTNNRELVIQNITDPLNVALRAVKYGQKGYGIDPTEMQKLMSAYAFRSALVGAA